MHSAFRDCNRECYSSERTSATVGRFSDQLSQFVFGLRPVLTLSRFFGGQSGQRFTICKTGQAGIHYLHKGTKHKGPLTWANALRAPVWAGPRQTPIQGYPRGEHPYRGRLSRAGTPSRPLPTSYPGWHAYSYGAGRLWKIIYAGSTLG